MTRKPSAIHRTWRAVRARRVEDILTSGVCAVPETHPISLEEAAGAPGRRRLSQPCCTIGRAHRSVSWVLFYPDEGARCGSARLTFGIFPHRRLILCVATRARAPTGGYPREWPLALPVR